MSDGDRIAHVDALATYTPPGHSGTRNVRLVEGVEAAGFEMVLGRLEPGGKADRHHHAEAYQAMYVIGGRAQVALGEAAPEICGPGTVVRIPPGLAHEVTSLGPEPLELLLVYAPPLAAGD